MEDDSDEYVCPLCVEEMDFTDRHFKPCQCGYQICLWCWHQIMESAAKVDGEGRCPACRTAYDKEKISQSAPKPDELTEIFDQKHQRAQKAKSHMSAGRKHLSNVRVVQRNLAYIVGLPLSVASEETLERREYFGQYGKIMKIAVSRSSTYNAPNGPNGPTASVYVTFVRNEDALKCIQAVDGAVLEGKTLRASFGTTKYCSLWLKHMPCTSPDCLYLHDIGTQEDSFTKEEMLANKHQVFHDVTHAGSRRFGTGLPPPPGESSASQAIPIPSSGPQHNQQQSMSTAGSPMMAGSPIMVGSPVLGSPGRAGLPPSSSWGAKGTVTKPTLPTPRVAAVVPPKPRPIAVPGPGPPASGMVSAPSTVSPLISTSGAAASLQPQYRPSAAVLSGRVIQASAHPPPIVMPLSSQSSVSAAVPARPDQRSGWGVSAAAAAAAAAAAMALSGRPASSTPAEGIQPVSPPPATKVGDPKMSTSSGSTSSPVNSTAGTQTAARGVQARALARQVVIAHGAPPGISLSSSAGTGLSSGASTSGGSGPTSISGAGSSGSLAPQPLSFAAAAAAGTPLAATVVGQSVSSANSALTSEGLGSTWQGTSNTGHGHLEGRLAGGPSGIWAAVAAGGGGLAMSSAGSQQGAGCVGNPPITNAGVSTGQDTIPPKQSTFLAVASSGLGKGGDSDEMASGSSQSLSRAGSLDRASSLGVVSGAADGNIFRTKSGDIFAGLASSGTKISLAGSDQQPHVESRAVTGGTSSSNRASTAVTASPPPGFELMEAIANDGLSQAQYAGIGEGPVAENGIEDEGMTVGTGWRDDFRNGIPPVGGFDDAERVHTVVTGLQEEELMSAIGSGLSPSNLVPEGHSSESKVLESKDSAATEIDRISDSLNGPSSVWTDSTGADLWHLPTPISPKVSAELSTRSAAPAEPVSFSSWLPEKLAVESSSMPGLAPWHSGPGRPAHQIRGMSSTAGYDSLPTGFALGPEESGKAAALEGSGVDSVESNLIAGILGLDFDLTEEPLGASTDVAKMFLAGNGLEGGAVSLGELDGKLDPLGLAVRDAAVGGRGIGGADRSRARQSRFNFARPDSTGDEDRLLRPQVPGAPLFSPMLDISKDMLPRGLVGWEESTTSQYGPQETQPTGEEEWQRCFRALLPDVPITFNHDAPDSSRLPAVEASPAVPASPVAPPPGFGPRTKGPPPGFASKSLVPQAVGHAQGHQAATPSSTTSSRLPFFRNIVASSPPRVPASNNFPGCDMDFVDPAIMAMGHGKVALEDIGASQSRLPVDEGLSETLGDLLLGLHGGKKNDDPVPWLHHEMERPQGAGVARNAPHFQGHSQGFPPAQRPLESMPRAAPYSLPPPPSPGSHPGMRDATAPSGLGYNLYPQMTTIRGWVPSPPGNTPAFDRLMPQAFPTNSRPGFRPVLGGMPYGVPHMMPDRASGESLLGIDYPMMHGWDMRQASQQGMFKVAGSNPTANKGTVQVELGMGSGSRGGKVPRDWGGAGLGLSRPFAPPGFEPGVDGLESLGFREDSGLGTMPGGGFGGGIGETMQGRGSAVFGGVGSDERPVGEYHAMMRLQVDETRSMAHNSFADINHRLGLEVDDRHDFGERGIELGHHVAGDGVEGGGEEGLVERDTMTLEQKKALRKKEKKLRREKERLEKEVLEKQRQAGPGTTQKTKEREDRPSKGSKEISSVPSSPRKEDGVQPEAPARLGKDMVPVEGVREREDGGLEGGEARHKSGGARAQADNPQAEHQGFVGREVMLPTAVARVANRVLQMASDMGLDEEMRKRLPSVAPDGEISVEDIQRLLQATWEGDGECPRYPWNESLERVPSGIVAGDHEAQSAWPINALDRVQSLERELQNAREKEKVIESRLMEVQGWIHHDDVLLEGILSEASTSHSSPK